MSSNFEFKINMPKISFVSNATGANFGKGRKRLRGDTNKSPEIKAYDPLQRGTLTRYAAHVWFTTWYGNQTTASVNTLNFHWNHYPARLWYPNVGINAYDRVGNEIFMKYLRIKGMVNVDTYVPTGVRWRLVLLKINPYDNDEYLNGMNVAQYLNLFDQSTVSQPNTWTPYAVDGAGNESVQNFDDTEAGSLMNFYYKVKDVSQWGNIKRKVIASGFIPPNFTPTRYAGTLTTVADNPQVTAVDLTTETHGDATCDYTYCSPLDIKVTLNDRVNCVKNSSMYWLIFEADCGVGFTTVGGIPRSTTRTTTGSPVKLNFFTKLYYTDN